MWSTIGELGEFGVIERVTARFPRTADVILGPGDDAAIVTAPDRRVVATTDLLVETRHFRREWSSAEDVGRKAAAQNLADIAAMGARPTALLVGLAAPPDLPVDWADGLAEGLRAECAFAGAAVVGGDTVSAGEITVAVTALGDLQGLPALLRDGALPGDVVAVTGFLGLSSVGYSLLEAGIAGAEDAVRALGERARPGGARAETADAVAAAAAGGPDDAPGWLACLREHRRPRPPYARGPEAVHLGARAMLDVSDGLVQDLGHIARASGVDVDVDSAALVPEPALSEAVALLDGLGRPGRPAVQRMLFGGEDHALAAAFPPDTELPPQWRPVAAVTAPGAGGPRVTVDGADAEPQGWEHFR
ncbi:thiamine-monophosphate kinase [Streptomonospora wellingtoniae]|uniref:Thiamine-monophosphate kinase n=1 Tax=Streptomonospora wellingtoniae TaxID=3075544 RepID=A0ABU2KZG2_9ACTN|nr:thiamine-monophosphate kinase [Streptomonospora sp. DSM 45055]MDT0304689.1 thiamine-monophosphate kinase [Streptomonospora sp. DSM 45055]